MSGEGILYPVLKIIGLSRFPNNAQKPLMLIKGDISQEKQMTFKNNLLVAITSIFNLFNFTRTPNSELCG